MITLEPSGTLQGKAGTAAAITFTIHGDAVSTSGADSFGTLAQGQLASSTAAIYTATPFVAAVLIKQIHLANTTGSDVTGIQFFVDGTAAANRITGTMTIVANGTAVYANGIWEFYAATGAKIGTTVVAASGVTNTPAGTIAATDVQAALNELDTEKVPTTRTISTTAPITGGGDLSANRTLAISAATTAAAGSMSAIDKAKLDNIWIDVTANSTALVVAGASATTNTTNINAIFTAAPNGSTIYFPPNATKYDFNGAWNMANKMFTICGRGSNRAGSPATAFSMLNWNANVGGDLIPLPGSGNGWYTQFRDLTFTATTADQASGAVINANGNVGVNVINCSFQSAGTFFFNVLNYGGGAGSNSGNSTVVENCNIQGYKGTGIICDSSGSSLVVANTIIQGQWGGTGSTPASAMAAAGIQGTFVGALQINDCDILGNINNLLINPNAGGVVAASVFCTNTYMDNSGGSCVKITGSAATVRCRFDTCSFTTAGTNFTVAGTNLTAVEIASTFAYPAGGQGIDFVNCNVLNTFGTTGTARGFLISGTADFSIGNSRIAGWGTAGIEVTPIATAGRTQPQINNNTIGPAGGYGANGTGIILNAGSAAYGSMVIESNILDGNTTAPMTDNSTTDTTTGKLKQTNSNPGMSTGQFTAVAPTAGVLTTVETVLAVLPLPPGGLKVGTVFRYMLAYKPALASICTIRIRCGTSASVPATDTSVTTIADTITTATVNAKVSTGMSQMTVVGASAAHTGNGMTVQSVAAGTSFGSAQTVAVGTFVSTNANFVMLTLQNTTSTTTTVYNGYLEIVG